MRFEDWAWRCAIGLAVEVGFKEAGRPQCVTGSVSVRRHENEIGNAERENMDAEEARKIARKK